MIVEITSPTSQKYDKVLKFNTYLHAGVREYWIFDPESETLFTYVMKNGEYISSAYTDNDIAPVNIFEGFMINL